MNPEPRPFEIINAMASERRGRSDQALLDELGELPPLADEDDASWDDPTYWVRVAYPYLALVQLAAERRLRPAIRPLLDHACFGDPGEIMRGLRHGLEAIVNPDWSVLADICIEAAQTERPGTILWSVDQLVVLDDERARPLLLTLGASSYDEIKWRAQAAIERLDEQARRRRT